MGWADYSDDLKNFFKIAFWRLIMLSTQDSQKLLLHLFFLIRLLYSTVGCLLLLLLQRNAGLLIQVHLHDQN